MRLCLTFVFLAVITFVLANDKIDAGSSPTTHNRLLKLEQKGIINADMYNQLGLSYYKQGKTGKAVLCFLRALRLNSNHSAARNNLNYVTSQTLDKDLYSQPSFLSSIFQKVFDFFTLNSLAVVVLILLIITILCLHWLMHLPIEQDRAIPVMWLIIAGFVLFVFATMLGMKFRDFHNNTKAVVIEPEIGGYSGPGPEYGKLFSLHEGLIIHINRVDKDWALITLPNGGAGWILIASAERVKPKE